MRNSVFKQIMGIFLCITLLAACGQFSDIEEIDDVEINASYAVPIINSKSTFWEIIETAEEDLSYLTLEADGGFTFHYEDEGPRQTADELFGILPTIPFAIIDTFMSAPVAFFDNIAVEELVLKEGTIQFELLSPFMENIDVTITFPQFRKEGVPLSINHTIVHDGNAPTQSVIDPVSLAGYTINLIDNNIEIRYDARNMSNTQVELPPILGQANNWEYEFIQGYWERDVFELEKDTLDIDLFEKEFRGEFSFADPRLSITLENSFGFPVMAQVNSMKMVDSEGQVFNLESTMFDSPIYLAYPQGNEVNVSKFTELNFNNTNSNIADLLNSQPRQVIYDLAIVINPDEDFSVPGFLTDQSYINASIQTEVPAHGAVSFDADEVVEIDFNEAEEIKSAEFKLITENGIPVNTDLQFYFVDANLNIIDSLFDNTVNLLSAAAVDAQGDVTAPASMNTTITIDENRMQMIRNATELLMRASISTSNDGTVPVKLNQNQTLDVQLGAIINVRN